MSGDPYDWKPVDVAAWLKTWYKDEDSTKVRMLLAKVLHPTPRATISLLLRVYYCNIPLKMKVQSQLNCSVQRTLS